LKAQKAIPAEKKIETKIKTKWKALRDIGQWVEYEVPEIGSECAKKVRKKSPIAKIAVMIRKRQIVIFSPLRCMKMAATMEALIVATIIPTMIFMLREPKST
jgi:hypothetical protein